jgi:hypothetical protein
MRPRAFIGSSKEHIDLARAVQENLDVDVETRVWDQDVFRLSEYPLEALRAQLEQSDFGIFILSPADFSTIRGKQYMVPRDNVIFELGLFTGHLGYQCTFIIVPRSVKTLHLPTDLHGLTVGDYDPDRSDKNLTAALGPVCNKIRKLIAQRAPLVMKYRTGLRRSDLFPDFDKEFERMIRSATKITLYFIHSRRWRENNNDFIQQFIAKPEAELNVFLPDLNNTQLIRNLMEHFDDGPHIPGLIADAYRYFSNLKKHGKAKVTIRLFNIYPTYTFYRFDDTYIVAMYPCTAIRKSVPAFEVESLGTFAGFISYDIEQLLRECGEPTTQELKRLQKLGVRFTVA